MKETGPGPSMNRKGKPFFQQTDDKEMIEQCLNCPWPKCWNCFGNRRNPYTQALYADLERRKNE